jgi:hypothetical protein
MNFHDKAIAKNTLILTAAGVVAVSGEEELEERKRKKENLLLKKQSAEVKATTWGQWRTSSSWSWSWRRVGCHHLRLLGHHPVIVIAPIVRRCGKWRWREAMEKRPGRGRKARPRRS